MKKSIFFLLPFLFMGCEKPIVKEIDTTLKDIDGNIYDTVVVGTQTWMAQNLKTTRFNTGFLIPNIADNSVWRELKSPGYCWYYNIPYLESDHGILYNWYAVSHGDLCPDGWRVPTDNDWKELETYSGMTQSEVDALSQWRGNHIATQIIKELLIVYTGTRWLDGTFENWEVQTDFWTSTENDTQAYSRSFNTYLTSIYRGSYVKNNGANVRCIKN